MKNPSRREISRYAAGLTALIVLLGLLIIKIASPAAVAWWPLAAIPAIAFVASYYFMDYFVERFIYRKIKLIYKIIHNSKTGKNVLREKMQNSDHMLEEVEHEVKEYTASKTSEIEQLKRMEQYRKEFLGNVSHELKTPIFSIQGYLETLLNGGLEDDRINKSYLIKASNNAERLNNVVSELLLISQYESGEMQLELEKFDIYELAQEVLDSFEMQADNKDIKLGFKKGCDRSFYVEADRERIGQVLNNLVSNAIKYGNETGGTVNIGLYDMDEHILLEVTDNGPGIAKEHLPRLFERFYRVDKHRSRVEGGTGLGLSIVKHIMEAHRQTINVRSTPGAGTTFGVTLKKAK